MRSPLVVVVFRVALLGTMLALCLWSQAATPRVRVDGTPAFMVAWFGGCTELSEELLPVRSQFVASPNVPLKALALLNYPLLLPLLPRTTRCATVMVTAKRHPS